MSEDKDKLIKDLTEERDILKRIVEVARQYKVFATARDFMTLADDRS